MAGTLDLVQLLISWGVDQEIINNFTDNDLEISHLKDITDQLLKELCPKIATRILIRKKINEYLTAESDTSTNVSSPPSCSQDSPALVSDVDESVLEILSCRPPFPEFDLHTLLSVSPTGNSIIAYYAANKTLTEKHRNALTDIICRRIFTRLTKHHINYEEYNHITTKIIALFPNENAGTYFVPPVRKSQSISGKPVFAKGKLVDKVRNTLFKSGERKRKPEKENTVPQSKRSNNLQELQDTHKNDVVFLKTQTEPWEDIIKKWKSTYELRQLMEYDTLVSYIEHWPIIINDVRSDVLIHLDFDLLHPDKSHRLYVVWNEFINRVEGIKINSKSGDETVALLVQKIRGIADDEQKLPSQIELLCHLVPPKGRLNRREKFSITECIETFLVKVKAPGDIQAKIEEISATALEKRLTVQPYVIYCPLQDGGMFYLVIDKVRFAYNSGYKAFDTLFKCYHALHISYPKAGYHLYLLIQKCVYDIHTKYDIIPPYITDLISNAKQ